MAKKKRNVLRGVESRRAEQKRLGKAGLSLGKFTTAVTNLMRKEGISRNAATRRIKLAQADFAAGGSRGKLGATAARKRKKK